MSSLACRSVEPEFVLSRDPQLAAQLADHATGVLPAWLWRADGSRILWANAVAAAIFGATDVNDCATRRFDAKHPAAAEIARIAATLSAAGQARLERLRGFGATFGRALTCLCSRAALADGSSAVLVVAAEPAGPALTLRARVAHLFPDRDAVRAVFAADGTLLDATDAARVRLGGKAVLATPGIAGLAAQALASGSASGATDYGPVRIQRLGRDASLVLVATFGEQPQTAQVAIAPAIAAPPPARDDAPALAPARIANAAAAAPAALSGAHDENPAERRHPLAFRLADGCRRSLRRRLRRVHRIGRTADHAPRSAGCGARLPPS